MAESHIKKSTIMFTDIFGYSRMVGRDEKHALKLLDEHNNIITAAIDAHNGSIIKFIGDAIFAEFKKPDEASHCSVNIQQKFIQRNKIHSKDDRIHIRIGLHTGDLVVKGNDLFGNTVNMGSRIESVAPVDGILNVLDVVVLVNIVLGGSEPVDAGDLNGDGLINVLDVVILVNIILQG